MLYTPSFLTINGLDMSVTDADQSADDVETYGRGGGLAYTGVTYGQKRKVTYKLAPLLPDEADSMDGWIKGRGHCWNFYWIDRSSTVTTRFSLYSNEGGLVFGGGTNGATLSAIGVYPDPWGSSLYPAALVQSGNTTVASATFGQEAGYSVSMWRRVPSGANVWELCSITYDTQTVRYFAGTTGALITTAFAWTTRSVASGYSAITLQGKNNAGTNADAVFTGVWYVPYCLSTPQLTARGARPTIGSGPEPVFPYVALGGYAFRDAYELLAKGFVTDRTPTKLQANGVWYNNAETLSGTLIEK